MHLRREPQTLVLTTNAVESHILLEVLNHLSAAYSVEPAALDPATAAVWYSTRGCQSSKMSADDTAEWLAALHGFKSATVARLEQWQRQLAQPDEATRQLTLALAEAPAFMVALNDYRLMTAAQHDLGEAEMSVEFMEIVQRLTPERQRALAEVAFLAWLIEATLRALAEPGEV